MNYIEYILGLCCLGGKEVLDSKELEAFLEYLFVQYRVAVGGWRSKLELLARLGIIELKDGKIRIKEKELFHKLVKVAENSYIAKVDELYRETLKRIKLAVQQFFKRAVVVQE
ncbi:MAG: hypothetical protein GXO42_00700 [bacterium]|nr:hypothetical protein [bacterium]